MTHDELLARITNQAGWTDNHVNDNITVVISDWNAGWNARDNANALRAVVELHKPVEWRTLTNNPNAWNYNRNKWNQRAEEITGEVTYDCSVCGEKNRSGDWFPADYPCLTIQAIQSALD